jgi:carboxyl-terminal processing protease
MSLDEAIGLLRGEPGSEVLLHIVRETSDGPFQVTVERAIIKTASVKSRLLEGAYGYVRLSQFQSRAGNNVRKALDKLIKEADEPLKGLVLDLRNNPGGVLTEAVEVSDIFLEHGLVVYTEGRNEDSRVSFEAKPGDMIKGAPLVVLVNDGSASASEIVAGALQDHSRAIIMGQKTFGKGSVQTIVNVNEQVGIKLTTARYFTPNGRSIQAEGIEPDIVLQKLELKDSEDKGVSLSEANLTGHLDNPDAHEEDAEGKNKTSLAKKDYALFEALNLLKGLSVLR